MQEATPKGWWRRLIERLGLDRSGGTLEDAGPLRVLAAGETDVGRERQRNEDAFLCLPERGLFIVADGLGGEAAGKEASRLGVETLQGILTQASLEAATAINGGLENLLRQAIEAGNQAILDVARANVGWERMGTTVVIAVVRDGVVHLSHVGDSRAYLVRAGKAVSLTRDHSTVMALVDAGYLTPKQARTHPLRNELSQCLGVDERLKPSYAALRLNPGDRIVLCTDGLWDMVTDEKLAQLVLRYADPDDAVRALIAAANEAGGYDNITVIVIKAEAEEPEESHARSQESEAITDPHFLVGEVPNSRGPRDWTERLRRPQEEKREEQEIKV